MLLGRVVKLCRCNKIRGRGLWRLRNPWLRSALALPVLVLLGFLVLDRLYPLPDPQRINSVIVLAEDGSPLRAFADTGGVWRYPVTVDEVSPLYIEALLGYEDRWFYYHPGVNPLALLRAAWQWIKHGRIISGGSTLTMQVARILDIHQRSLRGKSWQIFRALQLEWHYSKTEILGFYLNLAPFGGPIEGVQTASHAWLHKPAQQLSHAEAALLAVLPQSPSRIRPDRYPERAQQYRDKVLQRMVELGIWDSQVVADAMQEPVFKAVFRQPHQAPLFSRRMKELADREAIPRIETTLDADLQWGVANIIRSRLGLLTEQASVGVLVMDNASGFVRAYAGSADFFAERRAGHVDMVQAVRSPGSALKPFLYGLALDKGMVHSASLFSDVPIKLAGYSPKNFLRDFRGPVSFAEALQLSLNIPAVELLQRIGPAEFDSRLRHAGIQLEYPAFERPNLSLILGGAGTSLEQLVRGYSALARGGISIQPRFRVQEEVVERRVLSVGASWIINTVLNDVAAPAGFSTKAAGIAWKTGTSYGFRDAWAIGVNQDYTVGVWTGRPDGTPLPGEYGARASGPLLFEVFQLLPSVQQRPKKPDNVTQQRICWPLGKAKSVTEPQYCTREMDAWVLDGMVPPTLPDMQQMALSAGVEDYWVNDDTGLRVTMDCISSGRTKQQRLVWPAALAPWLSAAELRQMRLPDFDPSCPDRVRFNDRRSLSIRSLSHESQLKLPSSSALAITLQAEGGIPPYTWLVNSEPVVVDEAGKGAVYSFRESGRYELSVLDRNANVDKVNIRIIP